ncbi:MAG TPA: L-threonylcarbamoyladenylate synthase [Hyphomicrobiaceae bacterium]|nr:L-threonylcarbamoyladenylate synthase [Hyphomicrobiaceae bacterium]
MPLVKATPEAISSAADALRRGKLVAFPTETVYGLGADATNARAVAALFAAKGRPRFNPLIVHLPDRAAAQAIAAFTPVAHMLAEAFWPGPLSLVLAKRSGTAISDLATAGLDTVAVRIPSHPIAQALLKAAGLPVAAPSANRSGHVSPTLAEHVAADFKDEDILVLDGGAAPLGLESTVIDATGDTAILLRLGGIAREDIERVLGAPLLRPGTSTARPASPGMLARHYAPSAPVRLAAREARPGEALLAFGADVPPHVGPVLNLSPTGDLIEAAANLFAALRTLDEPGITAIAVMPIPDRGLGEAINDRLRRTQRPA